MTEPAYRTVCYRCSYEGGDTTLTRCPVCAFPVILESESTPPAGHRIEEIFARRDVAEGAPPLPGVHRTPRKAQILAEQRKRRIEAERARERDEAPVLKASDIARQGGVRGGLQALKVTAVCASAVFAGVLAAVLNHGL